MNLFKSKNNNLDNINNIEDLKKLKEKLGEQLIDIREQVKEIDNKIKSICPHENVRKMTKTDYFFNPGFIGFECSDCGFCATNCEDNNIDLYYTLYKKYKEKEEKLIK